MTTESTNSGSQPEQPGESATDAVSDSAAERGNLRPPDAPVLGPRPVYRPDIDKHTARAFRRPAGQSGSFSAAPAGPTARTGHEGPELVNRPPDGVLSEAFGRPEGSTERLQRDPDAETDTGPAAGPSDPWRDPDTSARLGAPAVTIPQAPPLPPATRLSAREVLFGKRVAPAALAILAVAALVIGVAGGLVGRFTGDTAGALTSRKVSLQQEDASDKPQSQVAKVADAVVPSVVQIRETVGDNGAIGSGVVIDGGAGYIVTNNHVVSMAAMDKSGKGKVQVIFADGTKSPAQIVGRDPKSDLAVLKVDVKNLTAARLGKSSDVQVGDDVLAVGSPLGLTKTVTSGIVSALNRPMAEPTEPGDDTAGAFDAVQTDAAINHGNSGGALVDGQGRLIGINTAIRSESGGSVGLGFAIPIDLVQRIAQTLIRDGAVHHPTLGVSARDKGVENDAMSGAQVADVQANSAAAKAGIAEGDVIVKVGDREVSDQEELTVAVQSLAIGQKVDIQAVRDGRQVSFPVTLESD